MYYSARQLGVINSGRPHQKIGPANMILRSCQDTKRKLGNIVQVNASPLSIC